MASVKQHPIQIFGMDLPAATAVMPLQQVRHRRWLRRVAALAVGFVLAIAAPPAAQAQTFNVIHTFTGPDGANPSAGVTVDAAGNLYGATEEGGSNCFGFGCGTVFKLTHKGSGWILTTLHEFPPDRGSSPIPDSKVVFGPDGALYGTTEYGGKELCTVYGYPSSCGTVFRVQPSPSACKTALCPWRGTVLYSFAGGNDGYLPSGPLVFDQAGNVYGTTEYGGVPDCETIEGTPGCGTVYELVLSGSSWTEKVLYAFAGGSGENAEGGVVFDKNGSLYGTTTSGGLLGCAASGCGTIFQLEHSGPDWIENVVYSFMGGSDGRFPVAGLIFDQSGNLYGTTIISGPIGGGTVFELAPSSGNWIFSVLYGFPGFGGGPEASLVMDNAGNLYGTTVSGGLYGYGSVFKLTPTGDGGWTFTSLHDFTDGSDGAFPYSDVVFDGNGNLYGTAWTGGAYRYGVVWEITP